MSTIVHQVLGGRQLHPHHGFHCILHIQQVTAEVPHQTGVLRDGGAELFARGL
jgi:hypothetical protein